jgi:Lrp/AsnC family leucine-responsive transcriptional regulator
MTMDSIDRRLLSLLMARGRASFADLGQELGLSAAATAQRVRRLEREGVIGGYAALVDAESVGLGLTALVAVSLERPRDVPAFLKRVRALPAVQECHHVAGDDDYLLKVRCRDTRDLERLVSEGIKGQRGVARTRTTIVLSTEKDTTVLALPEAGGGPAARARRVR